MAILFNLILNPILTHNIYCISVSSLNPILTHNTHCKVAGAMAR